MFITKLLSQHVSGIITPIIRRTRPCPTAYVILHCLCWLWLTGCVELHRELCALRYILLDRRYTTMWCNVYIMQLTTELHVLTLQGHHQAYKIMVLTKAHAVTLMCALCQTVTFTQCTQLTTQLHTTTGSTPSAEHHMR